MKFKRCDGKQCKTRIYQCNGCSRLSGKYGVPFRDAHGIVGRLVLYCIDKEIPLDDMKLEEYKAISPVFEDDIYDAISMKTCVERRMTIGAPGADAMEKVSSSRIKNIYRKIEKTVAFLQKLV